MVESQSRTSTPNICSYWLFLLPIKAVIHVVTRDRANKAHLRFITDTNEMTRFTTIVARQFMIPRISHWYPRVIRTVYLLLLPFIFVEALHHCGDLLFILCLTINRTIYHPLPTVLLPLIGWGVRVTLPLAESTSPMSLRPSSRRPWLVCLPDPPPTISHRSSSKNVSVGCSIRPGIPSETQSHRWLVKSQVPPD
jgi:hypothetical protein